MQQSGGEIRAFSQRGKGVLPKGVMHFRVARCREVHRFQGLLHVQFAQTSLGVPAFEIVNTVRYIGRLLDLGQENPPPDGVYPSRRQEKTIAPVDGFAVQDLLQTSRVEILQVFLPGDRPGKARHQAGSRIGVQHIPHLGFPAQQPFAAGRLVVRVHLDGQIVLRTDELDQQRKIGPTVRPSPLADQLRSVSSHDLAQIPPCQRTLGHDRLLAFDPGHLPRFPAIGQAGILLAQHRADLVAAPDFFLVHRDERQRVKLLHAFLTVLCNGNPRRRISRAGFGKSGGWYFPRPPGRPSRPWCACSAAAGR